MRLLPRLFQLAFYALALGGCAATAPADTEPPLPPIRPDTIARLVVDGPDARINGRPAYTGSYVADGDTVTTGAATSAKLKLNDGGEIQLDENTDPLFKQGTCLLMKILRGRVAFHNLKCQEFEDGLKMQGVARSFVHIMSSDKESRVTVITGSVDMRSPSQAVLGADMQYAAARDGAVQVLQLTPEQAVATVAWTRNYFRPRAPRAPGGLSDAQAGTLGGIFGAILDVIVRNKDRPRRRAPVQVPTTPRPAEATPSPGTTSPPETTPAPVTPPVTGTQPVPGRIEERTPPPGKQNPPPVN